MTALDSAGALGRARSDSSRRMLHPVADTPAGSAESPVRLMPQQVGQLETAISAVRAWLSDDGGRSLAVTGPVGIGKTTLLSGLATWLGTLDGITVVAERVVTSDATRHLLLRLAGLVDARHRSGHVEHLVLLLDDFDHLDTTDQHAILELPASYPELRIVVTATYDGQFDGLITLPLQVLPGSVDTSMADLEEFRSTDVVRLFVECVRRRNPAFELDRSEHCHVARICASAFGVPSEVDLLAELVDRYGLAAICDAVTEHGPRHHLGELLGDLGVARPALTSDETVVLASIFASPGGASTGMLRQSLPRCDIDTSAQSLVARGLVFGSTEPAEDELRGYASRYHLRVSAMRVASWCASQSEVSLAAIRHAQADYLQAQIRRMAARFYDESQRTVFLEFNQELPNLRCTVSDLIDIGKNAQAVAIMFDALALLGRTCGMAELLPDLLRVIRTYDPDDAVDRQRLALVAVRVFAAAGEQEAASVYLEQILDEDAVLDPADASYLGVLVTDPPPCDDDAIDILAGCVAQYRSDHDMARLTDAGVEYFARLMRARQFDRAEAECRVVLSEATRCGDAYAAGVVLLWRAVAACAAGTDNARLYVERALGKLRPLGSAATLSALTVVIDNRHLRNLSQSGIDLAMITGSVSRAEFAAPGDPAICQPVIPDVEERLTDRIGARAVQRWSLAGASADLVEMLVEMLKRRYVDDLAGSVELRRSGVTRTDVVDPEELNKQSSLTAREAQVASLVATGLTNKQVAFRLHISEWTVINHLRQVMRKLDCTSRVQVARWVSEVEGNATVAGISS